LFVRTKDNYGIVGGYAFSQEEQGVVEQVSYFFQSVFTIFLYHVWTLNYACRVKRDDFAAVVQWLNVRMRYLKMWTFYCLSNHSNVQLTSRVHTSTATSRSAEFSVLLTMVTWGSDVFGRVMTINSSGVQR